jgi:hypothetical protein
MIAVTLPLPCAVIDLSADSAVKVGVMSLTLRLEVEEVALAEELALALVLVLAEAAGELAAAVLELELLDELQAAISIAALTPAATRPAFLIREDTNLPRFSLFVPSRPTNRPTKRANLTSWPQVTS